MTQEHPQRHSPILKCPKSLHVYFSWKKKILNRILQDESKISKLHNSPTIWKGSWDLTYVVWVPVLEMQLNTCCQKHSPAWQQVFIELDFLKYFSSTSGFVCGFP